MSAPSLLASSRLLLALGLALAGGSACSSPQPESPGEESAQAAPLSAGAPQATPLELLLAHKNRPHAAGVQAGPARAGAPEGAAPGDDASSTKPARPGAPIDLGRDTPPVALQPAGNAPVGTPVDLNQQAAAPAARAGEKP